MTSIDDTINLKKEVKKKKQKRKRCSFKDCKKKLNDVMIIINKCKCEKYFCNKHKNANKHFCEFKYSKEEYLKKINLGGGVVDKLIKI